MDVQSHVQHRTHGKLLISSEYFILDGAVGLALPTRFGQLLEVGHRYNAGRKSRFLDSCGGWVGRTQHYYHLNSNPEAP